MPERLAELARAVAANHEMRGSQELVTALADIRGRMDRDDVIAVLRLSELVELEPYQDGFLVAIESSPGWPIWSVLDDPHNRWVRQLRLRLAARGFRPMEMG
jgi:hypothetical protein